MRMTILLYKTKTKWASIYLDTVLVDFYCQLEDTRLNWEEQPSVKNCLGQNDLWLCLWGIVVIDDWCKIVYPTVGGGIPRQMVLASTRKLAEHELGEQASK